MSTDHNDFYYEKGDAAYGIVSSHDRRGAYIELDNGQMAYSFNAGNVRNNTRVICTVTKSAWDGHYCIAKLDSVCGIYETDAA